MRLRRWGGAALAVCVVALLPAACSPDETDVPALEDVRSEESGPQESGTASDAPSSTPTGDDTGESPVVVETLTDAPDDAGQAAVHEAYVEFWTADAAVLADPAVPLETLTELLLDPQRARTSGSIEQQRAAGQRSVGVIRVEPVVVTIEAERATLDDCLDDSGLSAVSADGSPVPDSAGSRTPLRAVLSLVEGRWLVQDLQPRVDADCA